MREEVQSCLMGLLDYLLIQHDDLLNPALHFTAAMDGLERIFKTAYYKKDMLPYVKAVLLDYVRAEMECMRKKERGLSKPIIVLNAPAGAPQVADPEREGTKLSVSCSVEVLAYFFRLLIEQGLVTIIA